MTFVQFSSMKVSEVPDPRVFLRQVGPWLAQREAENCYILGDLGDLAAEHGRIAPRARLFTLHDGDLLCSVAVLYGDGTLMITWCTLEMVNAWVTGLANANCKVGRIFAPAYTSGRFSEQWAQTFRMAREIGQAERIFQLSRLSYTAPTNGRLELATPADAAMLKPWFEGFSSETDFQVTGEALYHTRDELISRKQLFLWKDPQPRAMAAWVRPTPHGASINFVFVPPAQRGKGLGKAVAATMAQQMLASGLRYCFILTDAGDLRNNRLYQSIGARTVAELLLCKIVAPSVPTPPPAGIRFSR